MTQNTKSAKDSIYESCVSLISEKGLYDLNVRQITDKAGCNRCTFYNYYSSLDALILEIEDNFVEEVQKRMLQIKDNFQEDTEAVLQLMYSTYSAFGNLAFQLLGPQGDPRIRNKVCRLAIKNFRLYQNINADPAILEYIFSFVLAGISGAAEYRRQSQSPLSDEQFVRLMKNLIQNGVVEAARKSSTELSI